MAILQRGIIGEVSGKLSGAEFASYKGRTILKQQKIRQSSTSPARGRAQAYHAAAIQHWQGLTDPERLAWNTIAQQKKRKDRFGNESSLNGQQLYLSMPVWPIVFGSQPFWNLPPMQKYVGDFEADCRATAPQSFEVFRHYNAYYESVMISIWISRFRPSNSTARAYTWKKIGSWGCLNSLWTNFSPFMVKEQIALVQGEIISIKLCHYTLDYWPVHIESPNITVS